MWVSQSYLATVEPEAKIFIYYMFEDYNDQGPFTEQVQLELEKIGEVHGGEVSLLMPNPRYANRIEAEVREIRPLWEMIYSGLPGLLVTTEPMKELSESTDGCVFIPFEGEDPKLVAGKILQVRQLTENQLSHMFKSRTVSAPPSFPKKFKDAWEIKPGIFGIKIDLRQIFTRSG